MNLTGRRLTPELMDDPAADPRELERALRFIRFVNRPLPRGLGGASPTIRHLNRLFAQQGSDRASPIRILDIATGSADIPLAILRWADRRGLDVRITAIDLHETTLALARKHIAGEARIELVRADALKLLDRYEPASFDCVHAALFIHHLHDVDVITLLRIMDRLAKRCVIWSDLVRSPFAKTIIRAAGFTLPAMARHDAIVSFEAGFTKPEALDLAKRAGWERPVWRRHLYYRFTLFQERS